MSATFASLRVPNYRTYFFGGLVSNVGTWMGRVAQDWLVLTQLTDHSASALGVVTGLQFAPVVLLAPWAGAAADRFPKRTILLCTQAALGITAALTWLLAVTGSAELWMIYLLALAQGAAAALDNPTRQAFASELVGPDLIGNAVGLNSASFNAARLIGPAVAGVVIGAWGTGPAFGVNALSFAAVILSLTRLRVAELHPAPLRRGGGAIREGIGYVRRRPDIMLLMFIVFMLGTFGMNFQLTMALMATTVFGRGAEEYGLLGSIMAIGSLSAALLSARRAQPRLRVLLLALGGFTLASAAAAAAPTYVAFALLLIPCGLTALTVMTTANASVQLSVDPEMRGRVMALYMAIFMGGTPLGAPFIGWVGDTFGARWTIGVGAVATGIACIAAVAYIMVSDGVRLRRRPGSRRLEVVHPEQLEPHVHDLAEVVTR